MASELEMTELEDAIDRHRDRIATLEARLAEVLKALDEIETHACRGLDEGETREELIAIKYIARRVREGGKADG